MVVAHGVSRAGRGAAPRGVTLGRWQHRAREMARRVEGVVRAQLPSGLYRVEIDGPPGVVAHAGGGAQRNFVRLLIGDRVVVELMPRDLTRGRIVKRLV